ncbi:CHASE2 domain-containing protein [Leptolyngbya sp. BC1307]|uniref:CHASE2 domain-containing protein n=1 Tax=Leptolyngbya sp. BC1307 TaxID=2029589 RepID=UPI000EFB3D7E|nr:CHASE2 domain-containing protein [Leptolyngbya sp. BC1307]
MTRSTMLGQTLVGRYRLTRILGAGGFGQTYLAVDIQEPQQPRCVVKQLQPASQDANFLTVARRLFETEVKTLQRLGSHAHIPKLLDSFEEDNEFYLVQEFVDGQSLENEIKQAGKLSEAEVIALLEGVLPVLGFIHDHHVVHRDLKPDNLIRRQADGEIVLIDFGAVKEIRTRLMTSETTALTIGIGTHGYTPSEQLSGRPRYSSDIYALGMTAIQAITGRSPQDLPEDGSLDPCWQDCAEVSPGLAIVLSKMTRHYVCYRYESVEEVQRDLTRLDQLPAEAARTEVPPNSLPQGRLETGRASSMLRWHMGKRAQCWTVAIATVTTSAFILGLRHIGAFVPAELAVYDALVNSRADLGPDNRLLIVEVTEADLRSLALPTPSDQSVATAIENLQQHQPASIGLDLPRDLPQAPGTEALMQSLQAPNVIAVTKLGDANSNAVMPPPAGIPFEQTSFSDIVIDSDFRVRRAPMLHFVDKVTLLREGDRPSSADPSLVSDPVKQPIFSLGLELSMRYLEKYHAIVPTDGDILQLGKARFEMISPSFGGYQQADTAGYQMLVRYRSAQNVAPKLSFIDVLNNNFDPDLVKDKIVLMGSVAGSSRDLFLTPFNTGSDRHQMPGVMIHAQVASQILSAALDGETLPWAWPDWIEIVWIVALTGIGSILMVVTSRGPILILFGVSGLAIVFFVSLLCFQAGGWVPAVAPASAYFLSAAGARISKSYQRRHWEAHQ